MEVLIYADGEGIKVSMSQVTGFKPLMPASTDCVREMLSEAIPENQIAEDDSGARQLLDHLKQGVPPGVIDIKILSTHEFVLIVPEVIHVNAQRYIEEVVKVFVKSCWEPQLEALNRRLEFVEHPAEESA